VLSEHKQVLVAQDFEQWWPHAPLYPQECFSQHLW
jgi:hypothetical protein